jgi:hypothetical protein
MLRKPEAKPLKQTSKRQHKMHGYRNFADRFVRKEVGLRN